MPNEPFPERVFPRKLCHRDGEINSKIPLSKLLRLSEYLHDNHGQAEVHLDFNRDEGGHCHVRGVIRAEVNLLCQRCLEAAAFTLVSELDIRVAETEEEALKVPDSSADPLDKLEIVVCDEGQLDLLSLIEDELIMSLPIVASHSDDRCNESLNALQLDTSQTESEPQGNIRGLDKLEALKEALKQDRQGAEDEQQDK